MAELILLPSPSIDRGAGPSKPFIEPAPLVHVLFDQLGAHPIPGHRARRARRRGAGVPHHRVPRLPREPSQRCLPGCPACARLEQVQKLRLIPFDSPSMPQATEPVAA